MIYVPKVRTTCGENDAVSENFPGADIKDDITKLPMTT